MYYFPFLLLAFIMNGEDTARWYHVFIPWVVLLVVFLVITTHDSNESLCNRLLLIFVHFTSLASIYPQEIAYPFSIVSLITTCQTLSQNIFTHFVYCILCIAFVSCCPNQVFNFQTQIYAILWNETVHFIHLITWNFM
jgi:hypothetical protein